MTDAFVMTDQDAADNVAANAALERQMLREADLDAYIEALAQEQGAEEDGDEPSGPAPLCRDCNGSGVRRFGTGGGLSDWVEVACRCREVAPAPRVAAPAINHPGMTAAWFDAAVHRAICAGCRVIGTGVPGVLFVTSGSSNLTYRVTRTDCGCQGHQELGRCQHRALAIATADVFRHATHQRPAA